MINIASLVESRKFMIQARFSPKSFLMISLHVLDQLGIKPTIRSSKGICKDPTAEIIVFPIHLVYLRSQECDCPFSIKGGAQPYFSMRLINMLSSIDLLQTD